MHANSVFAKWALHYMVKRESLFFTQVRTGDAWGWKTIISVRNDITRIAGSADEAHKCFQTTKYQVSKWYTTTTTTLSVGPAFAGSG